MAGITLAQAETQLALWLAAETAVAAKQSYAMPDGRTLTYADAKTIAFMVDRWDKKVKELSRGARAVVRHGVPAQ